MRNPLPYRDLQKHRTNMMQRYPILLTLGLIIATSLHAFTRIDLKDNWRFRIDNHEQGEKLGWVSTQPESTEDVDIPHTWNQGKQSDYECAAWYFDSFQLRELAAGAHVELHFGAAFDQARVYLNGVELGRHQGGFTEFSSDVPHPVAAVRSARLDCRRDPLVLSGLSFPPEPLAR
jgi:hypothetical protein